MTITTNPTRNQYEAAGSQAVFNYTFKIYSDQDLNVYITPAGQQPDDSTDLITGYVIDSATIGNDNGGFITLDTPANNGDIITIVSNIAYDREVDYQVNGDFNAPTVNTDIDRTVSLVKQVKGLVDRAVLIPESGEGGDPISIPNPENGKALKWDDDGLVNAPIVETVTTDSQETLLLSINGNDVKVRGLKAGQNVNFSDDGTDITITASVQGGAGDVGSTINNTFTAANSFTEEIGVWEYNFLNDINVPAADFTQKEIINKDVGDVGGWLEFEISLSVESLKVGNGFNFASSSPSVDGFTEAQAVDGTTLSIVSKSSSQAFTGGLSGISTIAYEQASDDNEVLVSYRGILRIESPFNLRFFISRFSGSQTEQDFDITKINFKIRKLPANNMSAP